MLQGPKEASKIYGDVQAGWGKGGNTCVRFRIQLFTTIKEGFNTYISIVSTMMKHMIAIWWQQKHTKTTMMMMMMLIFAIIHSTFGVHPNHVL